MVGWFLAVGSGTENRERRIGNIIVYLQNTHVTEKLISISVCNSLGLSIVILTDLIFCNLHRKMGALFGMGLFKVLFMYKSFLAT